MKVWMDGEVADGSRACVSVLDHGLLYGDGIFEGMRSHGGRVFALDRHMRRLTTGARALHLDLPGGVEGIRAAVRETVDADGGGDRYIRLVVTRGEGPLGVDPTRCPRAHVFCIVDTIALFSEEKRRTGLSLVTSSFRRPGPDVLDPRVKSLNYLNNVLAKQEAVRQGADDALMLNARGHVAEASVANVFVVRDGVLLTPPTTDGCLDGVTRATVMELARTMGVPCAERTLGRNDFFAADEAFMTGTGAGIVRIARLDGELIGAGELGLVTERVMDGYRRVTAGGLTEEASSGRGPVVAGAPAD